MKMHSKQLLTYLVRRYEATGVMPTYREMATDGPIKHMAGNKAAVAELVDEGFLVLIPRGPKKTQIAFPPSHVRIDWVGPK